MTKKNSSKKNTTVKSLILNPKSKTKAKPKRAPKPKARVKVVTRDVGTSTDPHSEISPATCGDAEEIKIDT